MKKFFRNGGRLAAILATSTFLPMSGLAQDQVQPIQRLVQDLAAHSDTESANIAQFIDDFYFSRNYSPVWVDDKNVSAAMNAIGNADLDGLEPEDFGFSYLKDLQSAGAAAEFDVALTDYLARFAYALRFGKINPTDVGEDIKMQRIFRSDPVLDLTIALEGNMLPELLTSQRPQLPYYARLISALAEYRERSADGGWGTVSDGKTLRNGDAGPRVEELHARLRQNGWVTGQVLHDENGLALFDDTTEAAILAFQTRHGLDPDGAVGPRTLQELNVTAAQRVDQVRINLERARWIGEFPQGPLVIVNIAGFGAALLSDGQPIWTTRVIVGRDYTATPIFTDEISYIDFNPTWTAPRSIVRGELAPKILKDPSYLNRNDYYLARDNGSKIETSSVNWSGVTASNFPYWVVQKPGDKNALGRVKFMFPNAHSVYMHDTPNRGLFDQTTRSFSHGCIRTENPMELAEFLLVQQGWDRSRIDETVASGKTTRVTLDQPVPVAILYWTVDTTGQEIRFHPDIYGRDAAILAALDTPIQRH